ncbi:MAG: hypothetical protein JWL68_3646 [Actinomycetia bacterium]|nr:hypothetical protein [Actinomycetes bacterium]
MSTHLPRDSPLPPDPPLPRDSPAAADQGQTAGAWPGLCLVTVLLVAGAALDLSRCGIVLVTARHGQPAAGLVAAGLASAALSLAAARGSYRDRRWAAWAAVLIGITSAPQAAAAGFDALYAVPNTATAVVGILLTVAVLATVGRGQPPE